ncbi:MAG: CehA/McbA family metallohydrolase [Clostridium sp.]|uniref:CehA/McbA family metallohydrolase n=1 Tax=Clostridium sp. DSM 8431 TaxID=1761781 RepID=UPI0008E8D910|nr:CehA/McbA family metallohydrolase [Clostridium sp. DSM 8431]MCR4943876.1 CehA/McbA family metallohydrolase [Clostridium sp.]SFU56748.1 hypothetical protein SAMN04487886_10605 [Clostridium sp. DSM 8431]
MSKNNKEASLKYYYGIPHAHTAFSTGRGTPLEAYEYSKKKNLNFLAITDHNSYIAKNFYIDGKKVSKWTTTKYMCDKFKKKNDNFIPLIGFETKTNPYGDFNIINSSTFFTGTLTNTKPLILWMLNNPNAIIILNHPHKEILYLEYDEILNKVITSIEVGNGSFPNRYTRHDRYYYSMLDKGWKLGAVNGQDNHKINFGDSDNLTAIIAPSLNANNIIDAFRRRRTYSTESRSLKLNFKINNTYMGAILPHNSKKLDFLVIADDPNTNINEIQIITNKGNIINKISDLHLNHIKYLYSHERQENETWYVIKILQDNHRIAISSPIFIE